MADTPKLVQFYTGTAAEFSVATKDDNTLYFITDSHMLYKGETPYGGVQVLTVADFPTTDIETNAIYVNTTTGQVQFYNGIAYTELVKPITKTLANTSTDAELATAKAIYDFIKAEIAKVDASGIGASISAVEDRVTDLETAIADKAEKATTLAGYGITDAYTKTETDTNIAKAVADASHLKREIVAALPAADDADENTIYMVAKATGAGDQNYDEYFLVDGVFEKIGDTAVALTGYATETYVDDEIDAAKTAIATDIATAKTEAIDDAKDYADGLASNYATAAQGAKADSAVQTVAEGATDGTIAVDGTDVTVHGLKSAAYTDATDYEKAGEAAKAQAAAKKYTDDEIIKALSWQEL